MLRLGRSCKGLKRPLSLRSGLDQATSLCKKKSKILLENMEKW